MAKQYVPPTQVMSPQRHWVLVKVVYDDEERKAAAAIGYWDKDPVLVMRWNGTGTNPIGNPQSRGLPTWFVVPEPFREPILNTILKVSTILKDSPGEKAFVAGFFSGRKRGG